jgi:hypothetical protein
MQIALLVLINKIVNGIAFVSHPSFAEWCPILRDYFAATGANIISDPSSVKVMTEKKEYDSGKNAN